MSKELEKSIKHVFDRAREMALMYEYDYPHITKKLEDDIKLVEQALNELEDAKHNYKALKEFYNNAVAYGAKIQKELNELKKRNEPMKVKIITYTNGFFMKRTCSVCDNTIQKEFVYCPYCGQTLDWSDEK